MSHSGAQQWHIPTLDGIRGVAILLVVYEHSPQFLPHTGAEFGGCFGVDLFFVLSGFLITTLLLREFRRAGTIRLGLFYARRALRLFPALAGFLLACALLDLFNPEAIRSAADFWSSVFYLANWRMVQLDGAEMGVLNHLWSLSIEEQFYLAFPPVLLWLVRAGSSARRIAAIFAAGAGVSMILMAVYFSQSGWVRAYCGTDSHIFAILMGVVGACIAEGSSAEFRPLSKLIVRCCPVAVAVLALCLLIPDPDHASFHYGGAAAFSLASMVIIVSLALGQGGPLPRLLEARWLRYLGRVSYGLYLYHFFALWVLLPFLKTVPSLLVLAMYLGFSLIFTVLSWRFIEQPALRIKQRFSAP